MSRLRLAIVVGRFWPTIDGPGQLMANLAAELSGRGCQVTVVTARWHPSWPDAIGFREVPVVRVYPPPLGGWTAVGAIRSLARWLRRNCGNFDLVCVSSLKHEAYAALSALGGRLPVVLRAERAGRRGDCAWQTAAACGTRIRKRCLTAAAVVAPQSSVERELAAAGFRPWQVHGVPNGTPSLPPRAAARQAARAALAEANPALQVPAWTPVALYTGGLYRHKGLQAAVAAWELVAERWPEARLWLAGAGPERTALLRQIEARGLAGRVVPVGAFDSVEELLSAADLAMFPTLETGTAVALLEAMAAGLPIVAADTAAHRRYIAHGEHGLLVPGENAAAWAAAIHRLLDQPEMANGLGAAARQRAADEFPLARMVDGHLTLFLRLLAREGERLQRAAG